MPMPLLMTARTFSNIAGNLDVSDLTPVVIDKSFIAYPPNYEFLARLVSPAFLSSLLHNNTDLPQSTVSKIFGTPRVS
jgi:hypothetical protein